MPIVSALDRRSVLSDRRARLRCTRAIARAGSRASRSSRRTPSGSRRGSFRWRDRYTRTAPSTSSSAASPRRARRAATAASTRRAARSGASTRRTAEDRARGGRLPREIRADDEHAHRSVAGALPRQSRRVVDRDRNEHYRAQAWAANAMLAAKIKDPSTAMGADVIAALKLAYPSG